MSYSVRPDVKRSLAGCYSHITLVTSVCLIKTSSKLDNKQEIGISLSLCLSLSLPIMPPLVLLIFNLTGYSTPGFHGYNFDFHLPWAKHMP